MDKTKVWYNIIEELIQCPVCLDIPSSFMYQCQTGHAVCYSCMRSLSSAQRSCPICKQKFTTARNFIVEDLIQNLEVIQLAFTDEIRAIEQAHEKKSQDIATQTNETGRVPLNTASKSTQTNQSLRVKTSGTQTQQASERKIPSLFTKTVTTSEFENILQKIPNNETISSFYPCLIGSCLSQNNTFKSLVNHLSGYHRKQFFVENEYKDVFSKTFIVDGNTLPCNYDYAVLINKIALLFFNSIYHSNGRLRIGVQILQTVDEIPEPYKFEINLKSGTLTLVRHGQVTHITHETRAVNYSLVVNEIDVNRLLKINKRFTATLTVTKSSQNS